KYTDSQRPNSASPNPPPPPPPASPAEPLKRAHKSLCHSCAAPLPLVLTSPSPHTCPVPAATPLPKTAATPAVFARTGLPKNSPLPPPQNVEIAPSIGIFCPSGCKSPFEGFGSCLLGRTNLHPPPFTQTNLRHLHICQI